MPLSLENKRRKKAIYALTDQDTRDLDKVKKKLTPGLSSFVVADNDDVLSITEKF